MKKNSMTIEKPEVKFYEELLVRIVEDTAKQLGLSGKEVSRDVKTLRTRLSASDGMVFLTQDLPSLGKALDESLASDKPFACPKGKFKVNHESGVLPQLFISFWRCIYEDTGWAKQTLVNLPPSKHSWEPELWVTHTEPQGSRLRQVMAVRAMRQITYLAYKLGAMYPAEAEQRLIDKYIETDAALPFSGEAFSERIRRPKDITDERLAVARMMIWAVMKGFDPFDIVPRHGSGAVATGEKMFAKYNFRRIYRGLEERYPFVDWFYANYDHLCDELSGLQTKEVCEDGVSTMVLVPKDSRGPRLISMEPLELMWIQQGLGRAMMKHIERSFLTRGFVNFTDQEVNRGLALASSDPNDQSYDPELGSWVTLDLEDASDRVSLGLVEALYDTNIFQAFKACRSSHTRLPSGDELKLNKFAPMGSALCFPVESLTFWALAVGAMYSCGTLGYKHGRDYLVAVNRLPRVYGDDIIVRECDYGAVRHALEEAGLKLSSTKCCVGRFFRESCGCDAFLGVDITPVRLRALWSSRLSPQALLSWVSYANALRRPDRGCISASKFIEDCIREQFPALPCGEPGCLYPLAFYSSREMVQQQESSYYKQRRRRYNKRLQRFEVRLPAVGYRTVSYDQDDWLIYHKGLHLNEVGGKHSDPFGFSPRLDVRQSTRPRQVVLRNAWIPETDLLASGATVTWHDRLSTCMSIEAANLVKGGAPSSSETI